MLSIIIIFYNLFGTVCCISAKFYVLAWLHPLGFLQPSLNLSCSFVIARLFIVIYLNDILVLVHSKWEGKRVHSFSCSFTLIGQVRGFTHFQVPYWFTLDYILKNLSKSDLCHTETFISWGNVGILYISQYLCLLLKLAGIQQLALSLLPAQAVTVCQVMFFLGKGHFGASGFSQLWRLCLVIQSDMLTVYHSSTHLFSPVHFSFSALHQPEQLSHLQQKPSSFAVSTS